MATRGKRRASKPIEPSAKEAVFTMKLEPELRDASMAEASHRPAWQVAGELMREYDAFMRAKVDTALTPEGLVDPVRRAGPRRHHRLHRPGQPARRNPHG